MFTQQELFVLIKICDAGIRSGGLEIAEAAVPLVYKIRQIIQSQSMQGRQNEAHVSRLQEAG